MQNYNQNKDKKFTSNLKYLKSNLKDFSSFLFLMGVVFVVCAVVSCLKSCDSQPTNNEPIDTTLSDTSKQLNTAVTFVTKLNQMCNQKTYTALRDWVMEGTGKLDESLSKPYQDELFNGMYRSSITPKVTVLDKGATIPQNPLADTETNAFVIISVQRENEAWNVSNYKYDVVLTNGIITSYTATQISYS
jgi:hypothetical protein